MARIAIVNDVAGVGRLESKALRDAGWTVDFYDLPKPGARWPLWLKPLVVPVRFLQAIPIILRLRRGRYDFVHVHYVSQGFLGAASGRPYFLHAHGSDLHRNLKNPLYRVWTRWWMRGARGIMYVTPNLLSYLTEYADKATLIPNPIDTDRFKDIPVPTRLDKVLLFMRLDPIKGADDLFGYVNEMAGLVKLTAMDWGGLASDYKTEFGDRIDFLAPVPHDEVPALLARFDAVVGQMAQGVPGLSELEALAAGRVVLMHLDPELAGADPPPVINVTGGAELAEQIAWLRDEPDEMARRAEAGLAWVERHHSLRAHAVVLIRCYGGLEPADRRVQPPAAR